MEQLTTKQMTPTNFQPFFKRNFLLHLNGIDSFLIKGVSYSKISTETFLEIKLHDVISPNTRQQIEELLDSSNISGDLKTLDSLGTVINHVVYENLSFISLVQNLDYASDDLSEFALVLKVNKEILNH